MLESVCELWFSAYVLEGVGEETVAPLSSPTSFLECLWRIMLTARDDLERW